MIEKDEQRMGFQFTLKRGRRFRDPYGFLYDVEVRKSELFTYILNK